MMLPKTLRFDGYSPDRRQAATFFSDGARCRQRRPGTMNIPGASDAGAPRATRAGGRPRESSREERF
jgi:hypothetical protein